MIRNINWNKVLKTIREILGYKIDKEEEQEPQEIQEEDQDRKKGNN